MSGIRLTAPTSPFHPSAFPMSKAETSVAVVFDESKLAAVDRLKKFQVATIDLIEDVGRAEKLNIERRLGVGIALLIVRASSQRGEFKPWLEANVKDAGYRQCVYMMRLAETFVKEAGLGRDTIKAIGAGKVSLKVKEKGKPTAIQKAATEFIDGLTWGELLAKHEIRAEEGGKLGGARTASPKGKAPSPDELYEQSRDEIGGLLEHAETLFLKENKLQYLAGHPEEITGVVTGLRDLADKVEKAAAPILKPAKS